MMSDPTTNERGNTIERSFDGQANRYFFDHSACNSKHGWRQYDTEQDASYFGVWVNPEKRWTFTFCEGDMTLVKCPTPESFVAELAEMERFYGPVPKFAVSIDANGTVTEHYDTRPTGLEVQS